MRLRIFPLELAGNTIDLGTILLYIDISEEEDLSTVTLLMTS